MTSRELQGNFQLEIQNSDQPGILSSDVIFYWLNNAIQTYVDNKYSNERESFEQTQKVTDELKGLVKEIILPLTWDILIHLNNHYYFSNLPSDYKHMLSEAVWIEFYYDINNNLIEIVDTIPPVGAARAGSKLVSITNSSSATVQNQISDPYSPHKFHYEMAHPLRLFTGEGIQLIADKWYKCASHKIRYLIIPTEINLEGSELDYLPESVHTNIVQLAAGLYLKSIGVGVPPNRQKELQAITAKNIQTI